MLARLLALLGSQVKLPRSALQASPLKLQGGDLEALTAILGSALSWRVDLGLAFTHDERSRTNSQGRQPDLEPLKGLRILVLTS